ncbi:hypothetical protein MNR01_01745 [Lysobacter sp. S4-A87]|uniref:hypothetical protein n=1 Tax=Lysobacter sp. S4-A87 TaxID=2925843 RepID=UPI001F5335CF|nr:hypothetical protein [Lysobacter sp. S4-A87]UNK49785.1 hypothetical protein MNR01_01745 [Lysobacter sp. S4-A87]
MNTNLFYGTRSNVVEVVDIEREIASWMRHYRQYVVVFRSDDYLPAVKLGLSAYLRGQSFDDCLEELEKSYLRVRGESRLDWYEALPVARASWTRLAEQQSGGAAGRQPELCGLGNAA